MSFLLVFYKNVRVIEIYTFWDHTKNVTYHYHMLMLNIFNTNGDIFATQLKIDQKYEKFDYAKGVVKNGKSGKQGKPFIQDLSWK